MNDSDREKLEKLQRKRRSLRAKITHFDNYLKVVSSCETLTDIQRIDLDGRFSKFNDIYPEFDKLQTEIEMLSDTPEVMYSYREQIEVHYYTLCAQARALLAMANSSHREESVPKFQDAESGGKSFVRLPKISLPQFDGGYQYWLEYKETYLSLIHNADNLDDISKFHYLRASLQGDAALIIKNIDFNSENYKTAWQQLCDRYDNNRSLINNHIQALFQAEPVKKESSKGLRNIVDLTNKNIRALTSLKATNSWDIFVIYMMSSKLDVETCRSWEKYVNDLSVLPTLTQFCKFLSDRAIILETIEEKCKVAKVEPNKAKSFIIANASNHSHKSSLPSSISCPFCKQKHFLFTCETFRQLNIETRIQKAKEFKVCLNCLCPGHWHKKCKLSHCKYCSEKHNTLLHLEPSMPSTSNEIPPNNALTTKALQPNPFPHVLLSTAVVKVVDVKGNRHSARVLLDNGSTANFITDDLCGKLGLSRRNVSSTVTGINNQTSNSTQSSLLTLESYYGDYKVDLNCLILPEITKSLPSSYIDIDYISLPSGLQLADPSFNVPSVIDILVGAEIFWNVLGSSSIDLGKNQPKLYETKLGWIVSGYVARPNSPTTAHVCHFTHNDMNCNLDRFWELDSVSSKHSLSAEERACEQSFLTNTLRSNDGRFIVTIPLKDDPSVLGDSYEKAKLRFMSLERRFKRDSVFKDRYMEFMREYENLGHMSESKLPTSKYTINYFLPHHGVVRESSTTTKLRTVFDASAVTSSGKSLNDIQMVGPVVQDDLLSIILRFRQHKYVVTGDIEKMYRAIDINPAQRSLQQIIFRYDATEPLKTYKLNTVTYGTASAPYLATKCLVSLATPDLHPSVQNAIKRDFYVDDFLSGSSSIPDAIALCTQVISVLFLAKFNLRKWQSNCPEILNAITNLHVDTSSSLDFSNNSQVSSKTLGLNWLCNSDVLSFSIGIEHNKKITKRHILSVISQIFDPLGLVGPCVVEAKMIMQKLWVNNKNNWDDEVSTDIKMIWKSFVSTLPALNLLKIPRWAFTDSSLLELHVFTDASERAYGACLYVRSVNSEGLASVRLLVSKNRVAPLKPTTIPRLELCAALLGSRLCAKVLGSLTVHIEKCYFWCDSTIVLGWLSSSPPQLKPFVRNRVSEIQESTAGHMWSYVPSKDNPADLVSRGLRADSISCSDLWWTGPSFLRENEACWPKLPNNNNEKQNLPEVVCHTINTTPIVSPMHDIIHKYSNLTKLQKVISYIKRFIQNCRNKNNKQSGAISVPDLQSSMNLILLNAQLEMFPKEYEILKSGNSLPRKNRLISFSPFLDSNGLIRVGGRLDNSPYSYDVKHPVLLCSKHHITKIIFQMQHKELCHAGPQLLLANIRQTYWPLGGKNLSKTVVKKCLKCFRYKSQQSQPIMGQLPTSRTELEFPFFNCGVDYAGPVMIADRKGRGCKLIKSYLCIFICFSVKAVHLELVTDLTKDAFMAAINRFISRRGKPESITSDNGTNFVGYCNDINQFLLKTNITTDLALKGIKFIFAPAYSPHFNGMAEAAVRSTKHHLRRLLDLTHLTYEEMATCLTQIEAILNSRPLIPISSDPHDLTALTPSHYLIGRPLMSVPHPQVSDSNINRLERYKRIEYIKQHFWNRFSIEYVTQLQQKTKWQWSTSDLKLGALVLIKDKSLPPLLWLLGRVVKLYPGNDGTARVADLKTKKGTIRRAFNNICPLPLD